MIEDIFVNVAAPFMATLAYAILFSVPKRYYLSCGFMGLIGWLTYLAVHRKLSVAAASFVATLVVVFISRILTVRMKCPITIFLLFGIIPLIPGAGVYYTVYYLVTNRLTLAAMKGLEAVKVSFAIVLGIIFIISIPTEVFQIRYWKARKERNILKDRKRLKSMRRM